MKNCLNCQYGHPVEKYNSKGYFDYCYECKKTDVKQYFKTPIENCKEYRQKRYIK